MSDLISRQTVIDMVKGWKLNQHIMNEEDALDDVNALPSAESERKKGKWIEMGTNPDGTHNIKCSKCGEGYKQEDTQCLLTLGKGINTARTAVLI